MSSILVVDDDDIVLKTVGKALKINGYEVDLADSGFKAVDMANSKHYDTILCDLSMPKMDGIEAMRRVKYNTNKLYMTGYSKKYIDSGIEFLSKPFGVNELINFIKTKESL